MAVHGSGRRMPWGEVPPSLRAAVDDLLGSPVVDAVSQPAGFSPGSADRVTTADGTRAFVKTASTAVNAQSVELHRLEGTIAGAMPDGMPVPAVRGVVDRGDWIAVVFDDVEGRHPHTPWRPDELGAVLDALAELTAAPAPPELGALLGSASDALDDNLRSWERLAADPSRLPSLAPDDHEWVTARIDDLAAAATTAIGEVGGDRLVHLDVRADNLLVTPSGAVALVDWPWAALGASWLDALVLLVNVRLYDPGADVEALLRGHPVFAGLDDGVANRLLVGLTGYFLEASTGPEVPEIPNLRKFQLDQGLVSLALLRERLP
ncbi:hypothetical protein ARHIZOSPH14_19150 [Agromyces rhizosphaerae]|uniref:Phosphotransferase n=1 Tax=Agromyces rhizosphaerae TaxID=88374 RepID=A0A9W6CSG7_9MICO|nr:phosphotransferase [Agromyces rhizosphaerae]GLI27673.1 hypothetical protein ARHIZOSPH14_19150 [Agromyces rhizosphaerae]